ncbi:hypothetical protein [Senegalimassilia anaerobia]|uniref:hypothetical protein n=1 Tax=Senegalimassilia anaerobia TaxID=1473216 RepID=UPI003A97BDA9
MSEESKDIGLEETQVIGNAEVLEGAEAQAEAPTTEKGRKALSRNAKIGIGVGCAAVLAAAVVGVCLWSNQPATLPADEPVEKALVAEAEEGAPQKVKVGYEGYEPAEGDTPVIAHITGTTDGNRSVDYYHAVSGAQEDVELVPGGYSVEYLPVLKAGGALVTAKDGAVSAVVEDGALASTAPANEKAAEDVTQDDLNNVLDAVKKAVEKGDDTLKGDAGKDVVDKVAEAVKATGKVDESKVEEAKKDAETKASEPSAGTNAGQPAAPTQSGGNAASNGGGASSAPASQPSGNNNGGSSQAGSSQPATAPQQPEHVHNWVAQTEQRWVQDSAAWDEPIYSQEARTICNTCGADISGNATAHLVASGRNGCSGYHTEVVQVQTGTIHHDAAGHYETVTTGYVCSGCGATK